jgi:hypothetical protein
MVTARETARVAELSAALSRCGHDVSLFTRRTDPDFAERIQSPQGYKVFHVNAGLPESSLSDDDLLRSMGPFAEYLDEAWSTERPDVAHAQCWMTGIASQLVTRRLGLSAVQTFQGRGMVSEEQFQLEATVARTTNWVAATCTDDIFRLMQMGRPRGSISVVPCGVDGVFTCTEPSPGTSCLRCCGPPTSSRATRGERRPAQWCSRQWHVVSPWWQAPSARCWTPSCTT